MQKIILLSITILLSSCTLTSGKVAQNKSHNYNHKPYLELKFKRKIERERDV